MHEEDRLHERLDENDEKVSTGRIAAQKDDYNRQLYALLVFVVGAALLVWGSVQPECKLIFGAILGILAVVNGFTAYTSMGKKFKIAGNAPYVISTASPAVFAALLPLF